MARHQNVRLDIGTTEIADLIFITIGALVRVVVPKPPIGLLEQQANAGVLQATVKDLRSHRWELQLLRKYQMKEVVSLPAQSAKHVRAIGAKPG